MAKEDNLKPFTSENQPKARRSRKGVPNRATVFKKLLAMKVEVTDPATREKMKVTLYEAAALGQIRSAMKGNTNAWKEIQDSLHGKQKEQTELSGDVALTHKVIRVPPKLDKDEWSPPSK